jgi:hypothetical protein
MVKNVQFRYGIYVNTKLTSKVPFFFGNFDVLKRNLVKNMQFRYGITGKLSPPVANISWKNFLGALFNIQKCPWKPVPPNLLMLPTPLRLNI